MTQSRLWGYPGDWMSRGVMADEDRPYTCWLRSRRCCAAGMGDECSVGIVPHHRREGHVGMGQRDHDHTAIPLCPRHHEAWHRKLAPFLGWTREERSAWTEEKIAFFRGLYLTPLPDWA